MKILKATPSMEGTVQLQWPENMVQGIGILLLICTVIYAIPRTAILGAILLTGYLGGAIAIMARMDIPYYFPAMIGVLLWVAVFLQDTRLQRLIPFIRKDKEPEPVM